MAQVAERTDAVETVKEAIKAIDDGDDENVDRLFADELDVIGEDKTSSSDVFARAVQDLKGAIPDASHRIQSVLYDNGTVVARYKFTGTLENDLEPSDGPYEGFTFEGTGEDVESHGVYFAEVSDGVIVKWKNFQDQLDFLQQVGILPEDEELLG